MTRRSLFALGSMLFALLVIAGTATIRAYEPCDDQTENRCAQAVTVATDAPPGIASGDQDSPSIPVAAPVVTVEQRRFLEVNMTTLSGSASDDSTEGSTPTIDDPR